MTHRWLFLILIVVVLLSGVTLAASAQGPDGKAQVARVYFENKAQVNDLAAWLDIWEVNREQGYFVARLSPSALRDLQAMGLRVSWIRR